MSDKIEHSLEDALERAYWVFDDKRNKKFFTERDCFKHAVRKELFGLIKAEIADHE